MKKFLSTILLGVSTIAMAQVTVSAKANVLLNTNSAKWSEMKQAVVNYTNTGSKSAGFNIGLSAKIDFPATSFFVMPEIYYSNFTDSYTESSDKTKLKAKNHRIDVPALVGMNVLSENFSVFIGPVMSYNLAKKETWADFKENSFNKFTVGYQFGAQAIVSKLIISARYEGSFSKNQREFINSNLTESVRYDNRPSFVLLGLGYKF